VALPHAQVVHAWHQWRWHFDEGVLLNWAVVQTYTERSPEQEPAIIGIYSHDWARLWPRVLEVYEPAAPRAGPAQPSTGVPRTHAVVFEAAGEADGGGLLEQASTGARHEACLNFAASQVLGAFGQRLACAAEAELGRLLRAAVTCAVPCAVPCAVRTCSQRADDLLAPGLALRRRAK